MSTKYSGDDWRVETTIDRLVSNIPVACKILRDAGITNLSFQLERDCENLVYWQEHGGLKEAGSDDDQEAPETLEEIDA